MNRFAVIIVAMSASVSVPQAKEACLSEGTSFDLCDYAKDFQAEVQPMLPMKLSAGTTLERVVAMGPTIVMYAAWTSTWIEFEDKLLQAGATKDGYVSSLNTLTSNMVCGSEATSSFVRLGGTISYHYRTSDFKPVTMVSVSGCP